MPPAEASPALLLATRDEELVHVVPPFLSAHASLTHAHRMEDLLLALAASSFPVLIVDVDLVGSELGRVLVLLRERLPWAQALVLTEFRHSTSDLIAAGASDILYKPFDVGALPLRVSKLQRIAEDARHAYLSRRELERKVHHAERLSTLGAVAAALVHEIAAPMSAISVGAEALTEMLDESDLDRHELLQIAGDLRTASGLVGNIIQRVRSFARRDSGRVVASIGEAVHTAAMFLRTRLNAGAVKLIVPTTDAPLVAHAPARLTQFVVNALSNALEALVDGGTIRVHWLGDDQTVTLSIEDDGPPIDDAVLAQMQQPFFTTKAAGLGLGMRVMCDVAEEHGGSLVVERGAGGRGVRVSLRMPRR